ncbi:MAG: Trk system potassium transporter TrkA [Clostridia bacterium]|nr:Trk system potassium transporter TrkA [Clostridia bacterium]
MRVIVVGLGKIGTTIVGSLVSEGHDVVAVDRDAKAVAEITNEYDVMAVCGNGADVEPLVEAGVAKTELLIAVTESDEMNMLSCFMAKKLGARHTIARIRNPEYNDQSLVFMKQQLELSMAINPELLAAEELFKLLKFPSALKVETFSRRSYEMVEVRLKPDSALIGMSLKDIRQKYKAKFLVCVVQRGDDVFIPSGNFVLENGDKIGITSTPAEIHKLLRELGVLQKQARSVMILGGGRTTYYLAQLLTNSGNGVKIIESDRALCRELCDSLPKAVVIHGDGAHHDLLMEEGISAQDAFVSLTETDESNILLSIFASNQDIPKVIAQVDRDEMSVLAEKLGLDCTISPRKIIADILIRYARALENSLGSSKVETLYKLMDDKAEALEFVAGSEVPFLGVCLKDLAVKPQILIAGIIRDRKPIIPSGNDFIQEGDRVVVIAANQRLQDLAEIV